ncbi:Ribosomal protein S2 bacteria/mitochondria/plastid [Trinorchestia longiramus]|nr:Ribosomal protein S2 bacteria/mitochondria/plastid [Trinorchestia longiramus]
MPLFRNLVSIALRGSAGTTLERNALGQQLRASVVPIESRRFLASFPGRSVLRAATLHQAHFHSSAEQFSSAQQSASQQDTVRNTRSPENDVHPDATLDPATLKYWYTELRRSLTYPDYFSVTDMFTVEDLFKARLHLGHKEGTLNDYMRPYILGSRLSQLIIDLDKTVPRLHKALNFLAHIAFRDGVILFVGRQEQHQYAIEEIAAKCGEFAHTRYWAGGVFTNSTMQFKCTVRLPDTVILLSTLNPILDNHIAYTDSARMRIPTVGVVDTNCDPRLVTYPVPASDDSTDSVLFMANLFAKAITRGKEKRKLVRGE